MCPTYLTEQHFLQRKYASTPFRTVCSMEVKVPSDFKTLLNMNTYSYLPYPQICFMQLQLPIVNHSTKLLNGNCRNKHLISLKQHIILNSVIQITYRPVLSHAEYGSSLCPAAYTPLPISHLVAISVIRSTFTVSECLCFSNPYLLSNGPKT